MIRNRITIASLVALLAGLVGTASTAKAQDWPRYGGLNDIYAANMAFEGRFDQWARAGAWQVALATPNNVQLPFNAMTISNSISEGNNATLGYVHSLQHNSNVACDAVGRWTTGAIQGNWYYGNGYTGQTYVMPYTHNSYYSQNGYMHPGYQQGGYNYYPMYYGR